MLMNLFNELKRRNVFKVAVAYAIVSWLVLQIIGSIVPIIEAPDWVAKTILMLLVVGFPVALLLAWAFELTPEGIKKELEIDSQDSVTSQTGQQLNGFIVVGLILAIGFIVYQQFYLTTEHSKDITDKTQDTSEVTDLNNATTNETQTVKVNTQSSQKSIAVLPFVNMSNDSSQEYFSDGMTEEILNVLVKNKQLLVTARTSAFAYKGKNIDIRTIGKELGVEHILEGSVRRAGDDLRITAQLIRVSDGFHLWSETYDRKLEKIFILQEEIAKDISKALSVPLGLKTEQLITNRTSDMTAYDLFLRGRALIRKRGESIGRAADLMEDVLNREPNYAPALALYSIALNYIPSYLTSYRDKPINSSMINAQSLKSARKAVRIDPTLAIAHYALANNYRQRLNWALAEDEYLLALDIAPNNIDIIEDFAEHLQSVGRLKESVALAKRGYELEPNSSIALLNYADKLFYNVLNPDFEKVEKLILKTLSIQPNSTWGHALLSAIYIQQKNYKKASDIYNDCEECRFEPWFKATQYYLEQLITQSETIEINMPLVDTIDLNIAYAVGGSEAVLEFLEQITDSDSFIYVQTDFMPDIRKTKRFKAIAQYLGLTDYWRLRHWPDFCRPISDTDFECD